MEADEALQIIFMADENVVAQESLSTPECYVMTSFPPNDSSVIRQIALHRF